MAVLVDIAEIVFFLELEDVSVEDNNLLSIRDAVEAWVQDTYCSRTFSSTSYKERYDGTGTKRLMLDQWPIISINQLSQGNERVIRVTNTTTFGGASVSVSSTTMTLWLNGTTSSITLADYATLTLLVAQINTLGSGWTATIESSIYASWPSNTLISKMGMQCINSNFAYLEVPDEGEEDFEVYEKQGVIYLGSGFSVGSNNFYIDYTAGYATIPEDLKLAIKIIVKYVWQRRDEESFGMKKYSIDGMTVDFEDEIPSQAKMILDNKYRRINI